MKKLTLAAAALAASTTLASAGGLDRSGQSVGLLFKDGNFAQLSFGQITPSVTGVYAGAGPIPGGPSGNMAPAYNQIGGGIKFDFSQELSFALIYDQP